MLLLHFGASQAVAHGGVSHSFRLVGRDGKKRPPVTIAGKASGDYLYARVGEKGPALRVKRKGKEEHLPKAVGDWVKEEKKAPSA